MARTHSHGHLLSNFLPYWEGKSTKSHDPFLGAYCTVILYALLSWHVFWNFVNCIMIELSLQSHLFVQLYGLAGTSYRPIFWFRPFLKTPVTCMWDIWWPIGLTAKASLIFVIYLLFKQNFNIASFCMVLNMFNTLRKREFLF